MKTVGELKAALAKFTDDQPVIATWEGILSKIAVYASSDGVVFIDADDQTYRERFENRPCKERLR